MKRMSKKRKDELGRFFQYVYQRALDLDPRDFPDTDDVVRSLTTLRAGARSGYYDVTGDWLSPTAEAVRGTTKEGTE